MHVPVLVELRRHVELAFGPATWGTLALAAGLPDAPVEPLESCGTDAALEGLARFLTPAVLRANAVLLAPEWGPLDLLEHAERALQAASTDASVTRHGPDRLTVVSTSPHRVCALARGVARGVGDHYGTPLDVVESACVLRGAPHCATTVSLAPAAIPQPRAATPDEVLGPVR